MKKLVYSQFIFDTITKGYNLNTFTKELLFEEYNFYHSEKGIQYASMKVKQYLKHLNK